MTNEYQIRVQPQVAANEQGVSFVVASMPANALSL